MGSASESSQMQPRHGGMARQAHLAVDKNKNENENRTWSIREPTFLSCASASGGSSSRQRRSMGYCRSVSTRSIECCRAGGSRGGPCTRSSEWAATRRMARSPPLSLPALSGGLAPTLTLPRLRGREGEGAWCCGAFPARISAGPGSPTMGSILRASCWYGRRAMPRSCGRWRRGCALPASPRWSAKWVRSPQWRAAGCSSPRSAPASPLFYCGAGATEDKRRASAVCRTQRQRDGGSLRCRRSPLPFPPPHAGEG